MYTLSYKGRTIPVYEYDDARELISDIARHFRRDVTKVRRNGRGRSTIYYYNYPCSFDIETTTIRPGEYGYMRADGRPLAFPYLFQFNIYGFVIMVRQMKEALDVFDWLAESFKTGEKRRLVIFDHNLGYEYGFFKDVWRVNVGASFALDEHHPATVVLDSGLMLRDSYKMTNMSLETLTKDWAPTWRKAPEIMDYGRRRTPFDPLDERTLLYSALDVLSLSDAIEPFLEARGERPWTTCPTSTSFIRARLKKAVGIGVPKRSREQTKYLRLIERCRISLPTYQMLLRQARGGNTHANRRITGQLIGDPAGTGVAHFDITSSYPAQMVCYSEYPVSYWEPLDADCSIEDMQLLEANGYCTLFDIVLVRPRIRDGVTVPYIPSSKAETLQGVSSYGDNGRYLFGAEMLKITIFGIEWPIIAAQYDMDDTVIIGGFFAKKGYLPDIVRRFVLDLYAQKTELKGVEGKQIEYSLAKTYVNGVYGMSYTKILREAFEFTPDGIRLEKAKDPEKELERFQKSTSYFLPYAWGAMVATLGRVYLQKMIEAVGEDFLYCDTDSVYAAHPEKSRQAMRALEEELKAYQRKCGLGLVYYDIKGRPHELGGIDEEPECCFMTYGAKKYITVEGGELKCTIAGVPKAAGARIIGTPERFKIGLVFPGRETNKMALWYNDDEGVTLRDAGKSWRVRSNIAMMPVDYLLGLSSDYRLCLQMEGINRLYSFKDLNVNMNEEYI